MLNVRTFLLLSLLATSAMAAEPPSKPSEDPAAALERTMADLVNRERVKAGLPPLAYDPKLAAVARGHSQDMKDNHFAKHESPTTGKVGDRLNRAKIPYRLALENLAICGNIEVAHAALMASEKHRKNILDKDCTRFGVGIVIEERGWPVCTQVFVQPPPVYDAAAVQTQVFDEINKERLARGLRRLILDDGLSKLALAHSERAAAKGNLDPRWLEDQLVGNGVRWRVQQSTAFLTLKLATVAESDLAQCERYDTCGLGVVQGRLDGKEAGGLWITLICAQRK